MIRPRLSVIPSVVVRERGFEGPLSLSLLPAGERSLNTLIHAGNPATLIVSQILGLTRQLTDYDYSRTWYHGSQQ